MPGTETAFPVVAAHSPSDCFDCAIEASRIALTYMTPVILLSDLYVANGQSHGKYQMFLNFRR